MSAENSSTDTYSIDRLSDAGDTREYITVTIGKQLFGMPIDQVHDVFSVQQMTSVPKAPKEIAGVLNLRGRIVTAVDMRRRLGLPDRDLDAAPMAVGVDHKGESYGLIIDEVGEVLRLSASTTEAPPANLDPNWAQICSGVQRLEGRLIVILDLVRILSVDEAGKQKSAA